MLKASERIARYTAGRAIRQRLSLRCLSHICAAFGMLALSHFTRLCNV